MLNSETALPPFESKFNQKQGSERPTTTTITMLSAKLLLMIHMAVFGKLIPKKTMQIALVTR
jgi:hypothetical protein